MRSLRFERASRDSIWRHLGLRNRPRRVLDGYLILTLALTTLTTLPVVYLPPFTSIYLYFTLPHAELRVLDGYSTGTRRVLDGMTPTLITLAVITTRNEGLSRLLMALKGGAGSHLPVNGVPVTEYAKVFFRRFT